MDSVSVAIDAHDELGESPVWDDRLGALVRVDIVRGLVHAWSPVTGPLWSRRHDAQVGAAVPCTDDGRWVVAAGHDLVLDDGERTELLARVVEPPDNRFNDCKADPQGRLWAGTMSKTESRATGALYRLAPGKGVERVVSGTTISNGLGWSPAGDRMYFVDSATRRIDLFDFDERTGAIEGRRTFAKTGPADGVPDGLTVDAEGGVWVSLFGGRAVRRYCEDGRLDAVIALPVTNPTSATFGGPGLRTLFVTSARHKLSERQLADEPLAGAVLAVEPGVAGLLANRFAG